jgi:DNA-binding response OmpR family regulator
MTSQEQNILLIEDDSKLAKMLQEFLQDEGYKVTIASDGDSGLSMLKKHGYQSIILDLMLPDISGLDICQQIRKTSVIPILMLTAKGDTLDRVVGLEMGADDYLPKPFEPRELLARLRAVLRRAGRDTIDNVERFGRLEIDHNTLEARLDNQRCDLTGYQFQLLCALASGAGRVLTRDQLMNALQGSDLEAFDRSIDVHISRIRAEIEDEPKQPRRVITVRGVGCVFAREQD